MRKLIVPTLLIAALIAAPSAAVATTPRADTYYQVWCTDADGNLVPAESVDAHSVDPGGKDHAVELFSQHFPFGWTCWLVGPITP